MLYYSQSEAQIAMGIVIEGDGADGYKQEDKDVECSNILAGAMANFAAISFGIMPIIEYAKKGFGLCVLAKTPSGDQQKDFGGNS